MSTLDLSIGALEVGILISSVLYGVATLQAFMYTGGNFKDPLWLRTMVGLVWVFETVHTVVLWVHIYSLTVTHYGIPATIIQATPSLGLALMFTGVLGAMVQSFYAHRVHILSGRLIIPVIAWVGAVQRLCVGFLLGSEIIHLKEIPVFLNRWQWLVSVNFSVDAAVDILNTSALCYYLLRRRSGFKSTNRLVDKLVMYTVETGLITSIFGVAIVATSESMRSNFVDFGVLVIYPKLFSNSFYASLNARPGLRQAEVHSVSTQGRSGGIWTHPRSDPQNTSVTLQLEQRRTDASNTMVSGKMSAPYTNSNFEQSPMKGPTIV